MNKQELLDLQYLEKFELIKQGKYLDVFIEDTEPLARAMVIKFHPNDIYLDKCVRDPIHAIRAEVARCGRDKDLDILRYDNNYHVKLGVLSCKRQCDIFKYMKDKNPEIRDIAKKIYQENPSFYDGKQQRKNKNYGNMTTKLNV